MDNLELSINSILSNWNPLRVDQHISQIEYMRYVPIILNSLKDEHILMNCLKDILLQMGIKYESSNIDLLEDLKCICLKILDQSLLWNTKCSRD
jgi:hypothetical protein